MGVKLYLNELLCLGPNRSRSSSVFYAIPMVSDYAKPAEKFEKDPKSEQDKFRVYIPKALCAYDDDVLIQEFPAAEKIDLVDILNTKFKLYNRDNEEKDARLFKLINDYLILQLRRNYQDLDSEEDEVDESEDVSEDEIEEETEYETEYETEDNDILC
ncbi:hypothetical protein J3Q64DRAFT_1839822 [Phycomyces blakesleeanus]|uniref:Uncharacterized protein n=1 Tax=Phycomyces blakesleeanus TaxID=4837 RepID=A0ABR3ANE5_PHYBL